MVVVFSRGHILLFQCLHMHLPGAALSQLWCLCTFWYSAIKELPWCLHTSLPGLALLALSLHICRCDVGSRFLTLVVLFTHTQMCSVPCSVALWHQNRRAAANMLLAHVESTNIKFMISHLQGRCLCH